MMSTIFFMIKNSCLQWPDNLRKQVLFCQMNCPSSTLPHSKTEKKNPVIWRIRTQESKLSKSKSI